MHRLAPALICAGVLAACSSTPPSGSTTSTSGTTAAASTSGTSSGSSTSGGTTTTTGTATSTGSGSTSGTTAASGTTTAASGTSTGVSLNVTFTDVAVHPAAQAALQALGLPVPDITQGYVLGLVGLNFGLTGPVATELSSAPIVDGGTYAFTLTPEQQANSQFGILVGVAAADAGSQPGPIPQLSCPLMAGVEGILLDGGTFSGVQTYLADSGMTWTDSLVSTGELLTGQAAAPTQDIPQAAAYAVPASYLAMLNCAGNPAKTTQDSAQGVALVYVTSGTGFGRGSPLAGVTTSLQGAANSPPAIYYADDYTEVTDAGTDATGVVTYSGVELSLGIPTITASGPGAALTAPAVDTEANFVFDVFVNPE